MSDRKLAKAVQALFSQMQKMSKTLTKGLMKWLLRTAMIANRRLQSPAAGFVLPTVVLLLLVVSLTVGALVFRAYSRSAQVIGESQQRVIYNAATPAIDRARAKLENLFDATKDNRYPGGVPAENYITGMLRNDGSYSVGALPGTDQYTIPDETRLNLDNITKTGEINPQDNAWAFRTDTNGDGTVDATVVYSILLQTPSDTITGIAGSGVVDTAEAGKAGNLWVRQGPLSNQLRGNCAIAQDSTTSSAAQGWFQDLSTTSTLRKNFQVDALVIPDTITSSGTFTTLELQQDRKLDRGNKWGAWFRNDLEIFPGPPFNWNGAMHTEGSLMVKPSSGFDAYLVSSQASCLMSSPSSSEITVTDIRNSSGAAGQAPDFVGLAFGGSLRDNDYNGSADIHIWPATTTPPKPSQIVPLDNSTNGGSATQASPVVQIALDPVKLLTEDVSQARGSAPPTTPKSNRAGPADFKTGWKGLPDTGTPRVFNQAESKPYVDDLYRADNRWGPKPRYSDQIAVKAPTKVGDLITNANVLVSADFNSLVGNGFVATDPSTAANVGLDGYWERRAYNEGLRVIVGQRLELGNVNGWLGTNDPLYPPTAIESHEARQRRTLRDNIAAVQATAIYHKDSAPTSFPVACLASATHPGTATTLAKSITFNQQSVNGAAQVVTDFFTGNGTNGWEFAPPQGTEANFAIAIAAGQPLGKALRNLANFAGDPQGFFPPKQETSGNVVHPYPLTSMWGHFSELRRTLTRLDGGTPYTDPSFSIADKTNLHTAACTLGMLAYNVNSAQSYDPSSTTNEAGTTGLAALSSKLVNLIDGIQSNGEVRDASGNYYPFTGASSRPASYATPTNAPNTYSALTSQDFLNALSGETLTQLGLVSEVERTSLLNTARIVFEKQQIERDRVFGFKDGSPARPLTSTWVSGTSTPVAVSGTNIPFVSKCAPDTFPLTSVTPAATQTNQRNILASAFCSDKPKFPALFYLFPKVDHIYKGDAVTPMTTVPGYTTLKNDQPTTEPYISDTTLSATTFSGGSTYKIVGGPAVTDIDNFSGVALQPKAFDFSTAGATGWKLPNSTPVNLTNANVSPNIIVAGTTRRAVGFLDRAVFNGREMMTTRMMDIDLGMLRSLGIAAGKPWLSKEGIVYAFREDAVREDAIARPAGGAVPVVTNAKDPANPIDPTYATTSNGIQISTKQVDYIADPDRRPYGFRLRNGIQLKRNDSFGLATTNNTRGLSFFTDNPVYIQGDFNLHKTGADDTPGSTVEEFDEVLVPGQGPNGLYTQSQFYGRSTRSTKFAAIGLGDSNHDRWRPAEILADGISILSDSFCDGSIEDGFVSPSSSVSDAGKYNSITVGTPTFGLFGPGCTDGGRTSFLNQNLPTSNLGATNWKREDNTLSSKSGSPVRIDRNGSPVKANNNTYGTGGETYAVFSDNKSLMPASSVGTTVDAIIVSGIVPSRAGQSYGGLHNFPRFLEDWSGGKNLWYAGSFLQLSFSNYATAPFDQDAWEPPSTTASSAEVLSYYSPPNRIWGYDPALQLAPAGPAASRFIIADKHRNEFYTELPANDPYIKNLCNAAKTSGISGVPATVNCPA